jgi:hypothetical protein
VRCSNCSAVVRPVVALDIDGTLGDYHSHFLRFALDWLGDDGLHPPEVAPGGRYDGSERFRVWAERALRIDAPTWSAIKLAYRQGAQKRTMPSFPSAAKLTRELRKLGAEVWLTTTRPYLRLDGIDPDTREWARRNGVEYDGLLYDKHKYRVLAERIDPGRVCAILEDLDYLYDQAAEVFGPRVPILARNKFNHAVDRPNVAGGLDHAFALIEERINKWKDNAGD